MRDELVKRLRPLRDAILTSMDDSRAALVSSAKLDARETAFLPLIIGANFVDREIVRELDALSDNHSYMVWTWEARCVRTWLTLMNAHVRYNQWRQLQQRPPPPQQQQQQQQQQRHHRISNSYAEVCSFTPWLTMKETVNIWRHDSRHPRLMRFKDHPLLLLVSGYMATQRQTWQGPLNTNGVVTSTVEERRMWLKDVIDDLTHRPFCYPASEGTTAAIDHLLHNLHDVYAQLM